MISVILPNFNGVSLFEKFLKKNIEFFRQRDIESEFIVCDDASADDSVAWLKQNAPEVKVSRNEKNLGFSATCNAGAKLAEGDILLFLNTDMLIEKWDEAVVRKVTEPDVFSLTPKIERQVGGKTMNESVTGGYFKGGWFSSENVSMIFPEFKPNELMPILWACGGALIVEKKKFLGLGGFDTLFAPFYVEDLDLSYRAWKRAWRCLYTERCAISHLHQGTIGALYSKKQVEAIHLRNKYLFLWKNLGDGGFVFSQFLTMFVKILTLQIRDISAMARAVPRLGKVLAYRRAKRKVVLSDAQILKQFRPMFPILKKG